MSLLTLALLTSTTLAYPSLFATRQALSPGAASTINNIQGWQDDIANVNNFLNVAATLPAAALQVQSGQLLINMPGTAADEPNRLMALTALIAADDETAMGAAAELGVIFPGVLGNLTIIRDTSDDATVVADAVTAINVLRCNMVLPDINKVFAGAVANNPGAMLQTTVGPSVCPQPAPGSFNG